MADVKLQHITKQYDKNVVIKDVSLTVNDGEFLVLVGPSGCGKSTLLRMIAGLESITEGALMIENALVNTVPPKDRDIAMVFQNYALYPHMTVYDNMAFALKMRKFPKSHIQQRVQEAAEILELTALLDRKPKQLSGGQRQRVALGRAIVRNPKVFLMDEPLSNLDAKLRVQMRTEIQKLHHRLKATTIYVTHDQVEAMTMGDRIVVLNDGIIQQVGKPLDVYGMPQNHFVAGFIGTMHTLTAVLSSDRNALVFPSGTSWPLSPRCRGQIEHQAIQAGQSLMVGIRPEHFSMMPSGAGSDWQPIQITPELIEPLGPETLLYFTIEGQAVSASLPIEQSGRLAQNTATPTPTTLYIHLDRLMLFHGQTQENILSTAPQPALV